MKKEHVLHLDSCEEVQQLHNFLTHALHLNAINRVDQNTLIQLLESSRIAILGRQA